MGKHRSSLRQVPWQSWEHWHWVATELFSDSPERTSGALDRIAAWKSRGKVPIAVETSAAIIGIHQRDPQLNHGISQESGLPEEMLRMMYAMAIQRLVNGVVDQSQKRTTTSVADRAELAGLPRQLVDIRHEAAHTELPGLAPLQVASKQPIVFVSPATITVSCNFPYSSIRIKRNLCAFLLMDVLGMLSCAIASARRCYPYSSTIVRILGCEIVTLNYEGVDALAWLKLQYWDQQKETLENVRLELKAKLVEHCLLVAEILNPNNTTSNEQLSEDEQESNSKPEEAPEVASQEILKAKKQQRSVLFSELLDLSLSSTSNLISIIVDDGLLERNTLPTGAEGHSKQPVGTGSTDGADITSATDCAWKFTLRHLSSHLTRLPEMLLVAIVKHIDKSCHRSGELRQPEKSRPTTSRESDYNTTESTDHLALDSLRRDRLISWCAWLLGKRWVQNTENLIEEEPRSLKLRKISNSLFLRADLSREILIEVFRLCLSTSNGREPLLDLVSLIAAQLGKDRFQHRAAALAQLGTSLQRAHRSATDMSEGPEASGIGEEKEMRPREGSSFAEAGPLAGDGDSSLGPESTVKSALELASSRQRAFLARLSALKNNPSPIEMYPADSNTLPSPNPTPQRWTVVENWRPCAIGMIPSPCHSVGILPSLDMRRDASEEVGHKRFRGASSEETHVATNSAEEPILEDALAAAAGDGVEGNRLPDGSVSGKKMKRTDRHVHFEDGEGPLDVDEKANKENFPLSKQSIGISSHMQEQTPGGSLLQGCLLQQGLYMTVTWQQLEALKSAIHVL